VVQGEISVGINADIMSPQDAVTVSLTDIGAIERARVNRNNWHRRLTSADFRCSVIPANAGIQQ
jgi:hypothetical protein